MVVILYLSLFNFIDTILPDFHVKYLSTKDLTNMTKFTLEIHPENWT